MIKNRVSKKRKQKNKRNRIIKNIRSIKNKELKRRTTSFNFMTRFEGGNHDLPITLFIHFLNYKNIQFVTKNKIKPKEIINFIFTNHKKLNEVLLQLKLKYKNKEFEEFIIVKRNGIELNLNEEYEFLNGDNIDLFIKPPKIDYSKNYNELIKLLKNIDSNKTRIILENYAQQPIPEKNIKQQLMFNAPSKSENKPFEISLFIDIAYNKNSLRYNDKDYDLWNITNLIEIDEDYPKDIIRIYEKPSGLTIKKRNNINSLELEEYADNAINELNSYANKYNIDLKNIYMKFYVVNYDLSYKSIEDILKELDININVYNWECSNM